MAFDWKVLGRKLREARASLLMSPDEAARAAGLTVDEYLELESGDRTATGDQIIRLAWVFRRDFRYFVTGDYPSPESQVTEMYRNNEGNLTKADRIAIQEFLRICENKQMLEDILGIRKPSLAAYRSNDFSTRNFKLQGKLGARTERIRLGLGPRGPVDDPLGVVRSQHVHVFRRRLENSRISGIYLRHPAAGHCILVNYCDDVYRQNFSLMHEYCHALFDSDSQQQVSYVDSSRGSYVEWRANQFAASFLVPAEDLLGLNIPSHPEECLKLVKELCHRYGVSGKVMVLRLFEERLIDAKTRRSLENHPGLVIPRAEKEDPELPSGLSPGTRARVQDAIQKGLSVELLELCREAYHRNEISYGKVLEILTLPHSIGRELLTQLAVLLEG